MNSQEIADAIKHHMQHTALLAHDNRLRRVEVDFKWNIGAFSDPEQVRERIAFKDSLHTWPIGSAEIAKAVFEQFPRLDTSEVNYDTLFDDPRSMFICLWADWDNN